MNIEPWEIIFIVVVIVIVCAGAFRKYKHIKSSVEEPKIIVIDDPDELFKFYKLYDLAYKKQTYETKFMMWNYLFTKYPEVKASKKLWDLDISEIGKVKLVQGGNNGRKRKAPTGRGRITRPFIG